MKRVVLALGLAMFCAMLVSAKNPVVVKAETISGTLTVVSAEDNLIFVKAENGITYDFRIGPQTKISVGEKTLKFDGLTDQTGKTVEVVFRPLKTGNAAWSVAIK